MQVYCKDEYIEEKLGQVQSKGVKIVRERTVRNSAHDF